MFFILMLIIGLFPPTYAKTVGVQLSGGADLRFSTISSDERPLEIQGLFLNLRKTFSDVKGDRLIAVGQIDIDDNFHKIHPYQTYIQFKGPMGKWNVRFGHYFLPIGLLPDYDTERLILQTLESLSLGIRLDTGIELFGYFGDFDYAFSLSQGLGSNKLIDIDSNKLGTGRIVWRGEIIDVGFSGLTGIILTEKDSRIHKEVDSRSFYAKRIGLDVSLLNGPAVIRGELFIGNDGNQSVSGALLMVNYALTPLLEMDFKYAKLRRKGDRNFVGLGFSYELIRGLFLRIADEYQFGKENWNVATIQIYYEFFRNI